NIVRLEALLDDLLDLSQMEMGTQLRKTLFSTRELTEGVLQQVEGRHHEIRSTYEVEQLEADYSRIEQVLRNLLQNAIRYVPYGGKINVSWEKDKGDHPILRVRDSGPGIPEVHLKRLFERFYRVDLGRGRDRGGTGIGLSLVKHIMQAHGGSVSVKSKVGEGSEFSCRF
ncbi:MAG: PAS domain-containing sensor histidine kinase, partial [Bdellovibrionales bacterium]|nr:PAS domain-containing sensor histidine kinase [Bdellovibrionales bacterium]